MPEGCKLMLLAPVVRDRKGEHLQRVRGAARCQGFVRARVDGHVVYDLDEAARASTLKRKHTIEVVVDRFKVRPMTSSLRLAESFETAISA
jgi:excinuclease ABC subunit A